MNRPMHINKYVLSCAVFVFLLSILLACGKIEEIKVGTIQGVELKGIKDNFITLKIVVPVENPNSFNLKIKETDLKVYIGDKEIGKVRQMDDLIILRKSENEYPITMTVELTNMHDIMSNALMMFSGGIHDVRLTGTLVVKSFLYSRKIKIEDYPIVK